MGRVSHLAKLGFIAILIAIHSLAPLLHAHMGTPLQTGFHLDLPARGLQKPQPDERRAPAAVKGVDLQHEDGEPYAVEVEKGLSRGNQLHALDPVLVQALLALCAPLCILLAVALSLSSWPLPRELAPRLRPWRGSSSLPPAHAPPLHA